MTGSLPPAGIREDDRVALRFANPGANPDNPFEQNDGRDYAPNEVIVARLGRGDWLEFELEPGSISGPVRALGADGRDVPAAIRESDRGIVVEALEPLELLRIEVGSG